MAPPYTTWEDFAQLGKTKREIYLKLNAERGGTMNTESAMHLNDSVSISYGWYCYNVIKGQVSKFSSSPINRKTTTVVQTWDNTGSKENVNINETKTRDTVHIVTLTTADSAKIKLDRSDITVQNVANSGKTLTVGTEKNKDATPVETKDTISYNISTTVKAGEKVELVQTEIEEGENAVYHVPYGASPSNNLIGTEGKKYNGHLYWGYRFNDNFGNPTPFIGLYGTSKKTSYSFMLKRESGKKPEYLSLEGDVLEFISDDGAPKLDYQNAR